MALTATAAKQAQPLEKPQRKTGVSTSGQRREEIAIDIFRQYLETSCKAHNIKT